MQKTFFLFNKTICLCCVWKLANLILILLYISIVINSFWVELQQHYLVNIITKQHHILKSRWSALKVKYWSCLKNTSGYVILGILVSFPFMSKYTYGGWEFFRFFVCTLYICICMALSGFCLLLSNVAIDLIICKLHHSYFMNNFNPVS